MRYENMDGWFFPGKPTEPGSVIQHLPFIGSPTDFDVVNLNMYNALKQMDKAPFWGSTLQKFLSLYVKTAGELKVQLSRSTKDEYMSAMSGDSDTSLYLDVLITEIQANRVPLTMRVPWTVSPETPKLLPNVYDSIGAGKIVIPAIIILGLIALIQVSPVLGAVTPRRI